MDKYRFDDSIVIQKNGKEKQNHTHYLNDVALMGTSSVLNVLSKPLTWWSSGLAMGVMGWKPINIKYWEDGRYKTKKAPVEPRLEAAAAMLKKIKGRGMTPEKYLALLDQGYAAHSVKLETSADIGTQMHAALEDYVTECIENNDHKPYFAEDHEHKAVVLFSEWAAVNVKRFMASEAYCYSKRLFTGGIVDLVYQDNDDKYGLLDFKSAQEAYHAHFLQNAGYGIAISENGIFTKDGELIIEPPKNPFNHYAVLPYGLPEPNVAINSESTESYKQGFEACCILYKLLNSPV